MEANNYQAIQHELAQESLVKKLAKAEDRIKLLEDALKEIEKGSGCNWSYGKASKALAAKDQK